MRRVVTDPHSPFISQKKLASPQTASVIEPGMSVDNDLQRSPSAATSRKSVPKRKSLAGLFGISLKRSTDRLRSATPTPPVPPMPEPSTPSRLSIEANVVDDTSPDTRAFYSRHGARSGFNLHGDMLHPDGEQLLTS